MKSKIFLISLFLLIFSPFFLFSDPPNSKDHPLLTRYPGSVITFYSQKGFDEFFLLKAPDKKNYKINDCKRIKVEGKVTRIIYRLPPHKSAYEVFKNYETALKNVGFKVLTYIRDKGIRDFVGKVCNFPNIWGFGSEKPGNHFYLSAVNPDNTIFVSIYAGDGYMGRPGKAAVGIVERKKMELGLITAKDIKSKLSTFGHVSIYGIYFDFNKTSIKPESEPVIKEIAKFLKENPEIKIFIVGHTDNVGKLSYNMELSKKRAISVVNELINKYNIDPHRLKAFGVGPLCPVSSNDTKNGRAKNRRVEIVKR